MTPVFILAAILSLMAILFSGGSSEAKEKHEDCSCKDDPCVDKPRQLSHDSRYDIQIKVEMKENYYTHKRGRC